MDLLFYIVLSAALGRDHHPAQVGAGGGSRGSRTIPTSTARSIRSSSQSIKSSAKLRVSFPLGARGRCREARRSRRLPLPTSFALPGGGSLGTELLPGGDPWERSCYPAVDPRERSCSSTPCGARCPHAWAGGDPNHRPRQVVARHRSVDGPDDRDPWTHRGSAPVGCPARPRPTTGHRPLMASLRSQ